MKIQDIAFIILLVVVVFLRKPRLGVFIGLGCFLFSIPLFAKWIFFTAERLVWYGAAFILLACIQLVIEERLQK